jgi:uncharacterized repeat protein (TIGR03843 family)
MTSKKQLPDKDMMLSALQNGDLELQGQFVIGSNYTFLAILRYTDIEMTVVYKPDKGERPLWDFPYGSLGKREVAAYLVSEALRWGFVPSTVYREDGPLGPGSLQQFIDHDPNYYYFNFSEEDIQRLRPVVVFDLLVNNADRKGGHILRDPQGNLWMIDHGLCFHTEDKFRTVIWDFAGEEIPSDLRVDLERLRMVFEENDEFRKVLGRFLQPGEFEAIAMRIRRLLTKNIFPHPDGMQRPYPWPPV